MSDLALGPESRKALDFAKAWKRAGYRGNPHRLVTYKQLEALLMELSGYKKLDPGPFFTLFGVRHVLIEGDENPQAWPHRKIIGENGEVEIAW